MVIHDVTLYYQEGTSDEVWRCFIEQVGARFLLKTEWGCRGGRHQSTTIDQSGYALDYLVLQGSNLVRKKLRKGYYSSFPFKGAVDQFSEYHNHLPDEPEETDLSEEPDEQVAYSTESVASGILSAQVESRKPTKRRLKISRVRGSK